MVADTIECPYCGNDPGLRIACRGCNGTGFIGCHDAPECVKKGPKFPPLVTLTAYQGSLYALDVAGELWTLEVSEIEHNADDNRWLHIFTVRA